jgi:hypothetical protein
VDATVPTFFISLDLTDFLGGPVLHYGLTDRIEIKASAAPLVRVSSLLSALVKESTDGMVNFLALGLAETGVRFYLSPYRSSWFVDVDAAAGFIASDYNFFEEKEGFVFRTAGLAGAASVGHAFENGLSVDFGFFFVSPTLDISEVDLGSLGLVVPVPKISATLLL